MNAGQKIFNCYCISRNNMYDSDGRIFPELMKSIESSNLFLPDAHHQDASGRKGTKSKFHQEHMKKNQTLMNFWENTKIRFALYVRTVRGDCSVVDVRLQVFTC